MWIGELTGQGWVQVGELMLAFALSAAIGLEREIPIRARVCAPIRWSDLRRR